MGITDDWTGTDDAPGYFVERDGLHRRCWTVRAPDLYPVEDVVSIRGARHYAAEHWRRLTAGARETIALSGLRALQPLLADDNTTIVRTLRAVRRAAHLLLFLRPDDPERGLWLRLRNRASHLDARQIRRTPEAARVGDIVRAKLLARARELAPRQDFATGTPAERLHAYLDALDQSGQPRWFLTAAAWRDLASLAGGIAVAEGNARLAELASKISPTGEDVMLHASGISELTDEIAGVLTRAAE